MEARMRISIMAWLMSSAILTSGALLAALARDFERPRDRTTMTFPIALRNESMIRRD